MIFPLVIALVLIALTWLYKKVEYKDPAILAIPQPTKRVPIFGNIFGINPRNYNLTVSEYFESKPDEKICCLYVFNMPIISVIDPATVYDILHDYNSETYKRQGPSWDVFYRTMGDALFAIDGPVWKERRNRLNHAFGPIKVRNLFPQVVEKTIQLVDIFANITEKEGHVDVDELCVKLTADAIFYFVFSKDYQIMTSDPYHINKYFGVLRNEGFRLIAIPGWRYLPAPSRLMFYFQRLKFNTFLDNEIRDRVKRRQQNPGSPVIDVVDALVDKGVSVYDIRTEIVGLVFAGHDTTAHAIAFTLLELTKPEHKHMLDKVLAEIDSVIPTSKNGHSSVESSEEIGKLVYLSAVIKEVLRIYPIAMAHPVQVQKDLEIAGYRIPQGSEIQIHYYSLQRLSKYWPEPLVFNPDRWLDKDSGSTTEDYSSATQLSKVYMPFLSGPHVCIGQHLAQLEMKVVLSTLLKNLTFSPVPGISIYGGSKITLNPIPGCPLIAKKRIIK